MINFVDSRDGQLTGFGDIYFDNIVDIVQFLLLTIIVRSNNRPIS